MQFIFCLLLSVFFFTEGANAQGGTIYNSKSYGNEGKSTIYNSGKSASGRSGPLSIKNMLRKKPTGTVMGKSSKSYSPYDMGSNGYNNSGYALSMTPDQVRAKQAKDRERARIAARENTKREDRLAKTSYDRTQREKETDAYTSRFRSPVESEEGQGTPSKAVLKKKKKKRIYVRPEDAIVTPEKVFGTIY